MVTPEIVRLLFEERAERRTDADLVEQCGSQRARELANLDEQAVNDAQRIREGRGLSGFQAEFQHREGLTEVVVELARDEAPFLLLRDFELSVELAEVIVRGAELDVLGFDVPHDVVHGERERGREHGKREGHAQPIREHGWIRVGEPRMRNIAGDRGTKGDQRDGCDDQESHSYAAPQKHHRHHDPADESRRATDGKAGNASHVRHANTMSPIERLARMRNGSAGAKRKPRMPMTAAVTSKNPGSKSGGLRSVSESRTIAGPAIESALSIAWRTLTRHAAASSRCTMARMIR